MKEWMNIKKEYAKENGRPCFISKHFNNKPRKTMNRKEKYRGSSGIYNVYIV